MTARLVVVGIVIACAACKGAADKDCKGSLQARRVEDVARAADDRMLAAMNAGLAEARRRVVAAGATIEKAIADGLIPADADVPTTPRLPDGSLHPLVKKWAIDGNGALRGEGPSMEVLQQDMQLAVAALDRAKQNGCR